MTKDKHTLSAVEALASFGDGTLSRVNYAQALADRAASKASLNALQCFDRNHLIGQARKAQEARPGGLLSGLPIVVKDNINTATFPTSGGTRALLNNTPDRDAEVIGKIIGEGGYVGAKAGMHELAFGITSNNAVTGAIRNPHDEALIPGGSSGGTAAAVAAGIFPLGLGTDTGGSCRIPASLCGVVGFRPTSCRYPGCGVIPISHTLDTVGSFARSVADISLLDRALTGQPTAPQRSLEGVCIGLPRKRFFENLEPYVEATVTRQIEKLSAAGVIFVDVSLEDIFPHLDAFVFPVVLFEVMRDLPNYLSEFAPEISFDALLDGIGSPDVRGVFESQRGDGAMPQSAYDDAMNNHRPAMIAIYQAVFEDNKLDALAFPTTALTARPIGDDETVDLNGEQVPTFPTYIRNTELAPCIGAPGISLPCRDVEGLPVGLEFDGLPGGDAALLALARAAE